MLLDAQPAQKTPPTEELAAQLGKNYHGQVTLRRTVLGLFVALMAIPAPAQAYPYYSLRPVDFVLAGPTDGHLASLFFNPAAIRVQPGSQVLVQGGVSGFIGSYQRQAALPSGFSPGGTGSPAQTVPIRWANPQALAALAWDLRSDSVTLGLAFSTPVLDLTNFRRDDAPIEQLSTRYHAIYEESYSLWGSLAIGLKLKSWLLLGASFNFGYTHSSLSFLRDGDAKARDSLGCGGGPCEQWASRTNIEMDVGALGYGFSAGAIVEPLLDRLWLGLSYL
ncbi:MAG TPA: hypothetical protein PK472_11270, partial [Pseudomonadota bacterium]|nr:hypothetical protein [Pseudomonadota bacterium]